MRREDNKRVLTRRRGGRGGWVPRKNEAARLVFRDAFYRVLTLLIVAGFDIGSAGAHLDTRLKILVAEDNADDVFFLRQAVKKAGVDCVLNSACDGIQTVAYLKGDGAFADRLAHVFPDILLLDLNMPGMNGFEVLEWVRNDSRCARLMVHVMSASSRDVDIKRAYELGANSYVVKPSRIDELVRFVSALDQWHRFVALPPCQ